MIGGERMFSGLIRDISERKRAEKRLQLSRMHAVLSGINSAIVRVCRRNELFNEADPLRQRAPVDFVSG